jgi:uncharacterized protein (TIGR02145 family)
MKLFNILKSKLIPATKSIYDIESIKIGNEIWAIKNLNVSNFKNGDPIPEAKTNEEWKRAGVNKEPAWCYYDNDFENDANYGKLYNWYAVNDPRGLAPKGWKVPSSSDFETLLGNFTGGPYAVVYYNAYVALINDGTSGFSAFLGGMRKFKGSFYRINNYGYYWTSSSHAYDNYGIFHLCMSSNRRFTSINLQPNREVGFSVRCLQDNLHS